MKIVELVLDESDEQNGIEAISIVENPAIEEDFVALKSQEIKFAQADKEKKILVGPLLTPNKPIFRRQGEEEYYIYFSRDTVRRASQLYLKQGNQANSTLEHSESLQGLTLVESWIVEDKENDKSNMYDMDVPVGTWMGAVKVDNDEVWNNYVKTGKVKGFSIEGYFADKIERPQDRGLSEQLRAEQEAEKQVNELIDLLDQKVTLESYDDYPSGVKNNAKSALEYAEKNGWGSCGTPVGKRRANQLSKCQKITVDTIKRMNSYLTRHAKDLQKSTSYGDGCGKLMYDSWGGKAGLRWSGSKLKELGVIDADVDLKKPCWDGYEMIGFKMKNGKRVPNCVKMQKFESVVVDEYFAIIDDRLAYSTQEKAEEIARGIGCDGIHTHDFNGQVWYMPCKDHIKEEVDLKEPCWDGYEMIGFKMKNGKKVPNCVKIK